MRESISGADNSAYSGTLWFCEGRFGQAFDCKGLIFSLGGEFRVFSGRYADDRPAII
jgi:hypothetical protein